MAILDGNGNRVKGTAKTTTKSTSPTQVYQNYIKANPVQVQKASTPTVSSSGGGQQSLIDTNNSLVDSWTQQQMATINQQKAESLASLEKSLNDAIALGQIDTKTAQDTYNNNKQQIEANAYQQAQLTAINGQNQGIQDSAQMLALQQGDNARSQVAVTANTKDRDSRIQAIQDRIAKFKSDYSTDVNTANQTYNNALLGVQGQAGQMRNQFNLDLQKSAYESAQSRGNMAYQNSLDKDMLAYKASLEAQQQANAPTDPLVQAFLDEQAKKKASATKKATTKTTTKKTTTVTPKKGSFVYNGVDYSNYLR